MKKLVLLSLLVTYNILIMSLESPTSVTQSNEIFLSRNTFSEDDMQKFDKILKNIDVQDKDKIISAIKSLPKKDFDELNLWMALGNSEGIELKLKEIYFKILFGDNDADWLLNNQQDELALEDGSRLINLLNELKFDQIKFFKKIYAYQLFRKNIPQEIMDKIESNEISLAKIPTLQLIYARSLYGSAIPSNLVNELRDGKTLSFVDIPRLKQIYAFDLYKIDNDMPEDAANFADSLSFDQIRTQFKELYLNHLITKFGINFNKQTVNIEELNLKQINDFAKKLTESLLSFDINDTNLIINTLVSNNIIQEYQKNPDNILTIINLFFKESFKNFRNNKKENLIKNVLDIFKQPNLQKIAASNSEDCYEYAEALTFNYADTIKPNVANFYANFFTITGIRGITLEKLSQSSFVENTLRENYFKFSRSITWLGMQKAVNQAVTKLNFTIKNDKNPLFKDIYANLTPDEKQKFLKELFQSQFNKFYQGQDKTTSFTDSQVINALETSGIQQGFIRKSLAKWLPDGMFAKLVKTFSILDPLKQIAEINPRLPRRIMPLKPIEIPENLTTDPDTGRGIEPTIE